MSESDNVIPIGRHHERADDNERRNPYEYDDSEFISAILSRITHPSMTNSDAHQVAVFIMSEFRGDEAVLDDWQMRFRELSVDAMSLSDDQFRTVEMDQTVSALIALIRSKNHHTQGNEDILAAARILIDLRTGYLTKLGRNKRDDPSRWNAVIGKLSKTM